MSHSPVHRPRPAAAELARAEPRPRTPRRVLARDPGGRGDRLDQRRPRRPGPRRRGSRAWSWSPSRRPRAAAGWAAPGPRRRARGCSSRCCCRRRTPSPGSAGCRWSPGSRWCRRCAGSPRSRGSSAAGWPSATLKWPNDVLIGERKLAGILAQRVDAGVIIGVGLNVSLRPDELPVPTATSLAHRGARRPTATRCSARSCASSPYGTSEFAAPARRHLRARVPRAVRHSRPACARRAAR